ncbi:MAG: caspase family protein [Deltaproteobacteria bacterium]|nr:caspase family protein [Deltaproteobacteria bacterium]
MWRALPLAALGLVAAGPALAGPAPARFALVVGNNHPLPGSGYETLQYADDDALRFAAFMTEIGASVRLFTGPDEATAERFGALAQQARPPRRDDVLQAIADLQADLQAVRDRPREVFVYFSGHGSVSSSQAFLHLLDGPFTRTDMRSALLERLDAERLHVIVDSCHAYFMVNPRGQRVPTDDDDDGLDRYPRVGFLLSTSARKEVQEWSGYEAGVFSHQLLGALRGAADVDRDGKVTYAEAHAYVVAANSGVQNPPRGSSPSCGAPRWGRRCSSTSPRPPTCRGWSSPRTPTGTSS